MFGLNKNKSKSIEDESIKDKSKFVVVGFTIMTLSLLILIGSEIYTSMKLSGQNKLISSSNRIQSQSDNLVLEMAKTGKKLQEEEYEYIKEVTKFMSPTEFQNFKNSITSVASQFNVQINSLNEGDPVRLGKKFTINYIEYQFLSTFENLTFLKNKLSETNFKINIIQENISRENPKSDKVLTSGQIGVYVFPGKEKLLKDKAKIIEKFKKEEEKLAEKSEG